jgi:hypothetical protein
MLFVFQFVEKILLEIGYQVCQWLLWQLIFVKMDKEEEASILWFKLLDRV